MPATPTYQSQQTQLLPVHTQLHPTAVRNYRQNKLLYHQYANYGRQNIANISKAKPQIIPQRPQTQLLYQTIPTPLALVSNRHNENVNYIHLDLESSNNVVNTKKINTATCGGKMKLMNSEALQQVTPCGKKQNNNNNNNSFLINNTLDIPIQPATTFASFTTPSLATTTTGKYFKSELDVKTTQKPYTFLPTPNPPETSFISTRIPIRSYYQPSQRTFENDVFYSPTKQHSFFTIEDAVTSSSIQISNNPGIDYRQPSTDVNRFSNYRLAALSTTTKSFTPFTTTTTTEKPMEKLYHKKQTKSFFEDDDEYDYYKESDNSNDYSFFGQSFFKNKQKHSSNKHFSDFHNISNNPSTVRNNPTPTIREVFKPFKTLPDSTTTVAADKITTTEKTTTSMANISEQETTVNPNIENTKKDAIPTTIFTKILNDKKPHMNLKTTTPLVRFNKSRNLYKKTKNFTTTAAPMASLSKNANKKPKYQRQYKSKKLKHMKPFSGLLASSTLSSSSTTTTTTSTTTSTTTETTTANQLRNIRSTIATTSSRNLSRGTKRETKKTNARGTENIAERQKSTVRTTSTRRNNKRRRLTSSSTTTTLPTTTIRHSPTQLSTTTVSSFPTTIASMKSIMRIANKSTRSRSAAELSSKKSITNSDTPTTLDSRFNKQVPPLPIEIFFERSQKSKI